MSTRLLSVLLILLLATSLVKSQTISPFIHVDQFGYQTLATKVAVLSDPISGTNGNLTYNPGATLELKNATTNAVVWSGAPAAYDNGNTHTQSGDRGWWVNFSSCTTPGDYYLYDPTNDERSATFTIGDQVYDNLMKDAGRAFFYNRCNHDKAAPYGEGGWVDAANNFVYPLQDTDCSYVYDPENASLRRDLSGGWFDAGDYNKYVTFAETAVHLLLWAYRESSGAFTDSWNIPESGNGIPDILDELKWEIDWLYKMTNADGSVINKMGSIDFSQNVSAPPSANTDRRYYGPTCTSSSIAAASMLAHAAQVLGDIPAWSADAQTWEDRAAVCFTYWTQARDNNALETDCDDGSINAGDADRTEAQQLEMALTAAVHLYELTDEATYKNYFDAHYTEAEMMQGGFWGPYKEELSSAMLHYTTLAGADAGVSSAITNSFATAATNNWNGFFGLVDNSLYRAFMPDWSFHWGSNSIISRYGNLNRLLVTYGLNSASHPAYREKAAAMLHYLHGVNPLGMVYLSGMEGRGAERGIEEIYHTWFANGTVWDNSSTSQYGPAPGFVTGGPNKDFSIPSIQPPAGQPIMKSYKDWNTGFPENSWEISEPAIYYQAAYLRNLAAQITSDLVLPVVYQGPLSARVQGEAILLSWRTQSEVDADYFEIQHLDAQDNWTTIGRLGSNNGGSYQFLHQDPLPGANSYRLRQVDLDGSFAFSNIATADFRSPYDDIVLFPNPLGDNDRLQMQNLPVGLAVRLVNENGQLLRILPAGANQLELDLSPFPGGTYSVELVARGGRVVWRERVVKVD